MTASLVFAAPLGQTVARDPAGNPYQAPTGLVTITAGQTWPAAALIAASGTTSDRLGLGAVLGGGTNYGFMPPNLPFIDTSLSVTCVWVGKGFSANGWASTTSIGL